MDRETPEKPGRSAGSESPDQLTEQVLGLGRRAGLDAVGVAPADPFLPTRQVLRERKEAGLHGGMHFTYGNPVRATDPALSLPGATALLVGALSYRRQEPEAPPAPALGQVARYSWDDSYAPLREALGVVASFLDGEGWRATVLVDDNALVDREAAYRAGLGWYGKNTNLLMPGRGSWFVLGSVVTDAPLTPSGAPASDGCGPCRQCLPACPTGALVSPGVLDARRCLAWLLEAPGTFPLEHREALGGRVYGCDDCQTVCPPNRANDLRHPPPPAEPRAEAWVDLVELLGAGDEELLERFGRWYIPRRQARYLRRNALVALGNVAKGDHPVVTAVLSRFLGDHDPMLREHAEWAARRLGRHDLLDSHRAPAPASPA